MSLHKTVFGVVLSIGLIATYFIMQDKAVAQDKTQVCRNVEVKTERFTVCAFSTVEADVRLFWGEGAKPYGHFESLSEALGAENKRLIFAMNAGMYHENRSPVGLYVDEDGTRTHLQTRASDGNFGMLPNGVFYKTDKGLAVKETKAFQEASAAPEFATQSGPMLVIDNVLHPKFNKGSTSKRIRNGVGVSADGQTVYFAMSEQPVTFYEFASLFKDALKTPNALYLDGVISRLFDANSGRSDYGMAMGPIVAVIGPAESAIIRGVE